MCLFWRTAPEVHHSESTFNQNQQWEEVTKVEPERAWHPASASLELMQQQWRMSRACPQLSTPTACRHSHRSVVICTHTNKAALFCLRSNLPGSGKPVASTASLWQRPAYPLVLIINETLLSSHRGSIPRAELCPSHIFPLDDTDKMRLIEERWFNSLFPRLSVCCTGTCTLVTCDWKQILLPASRYCWFSESTAAAWYKPTLAPAEEKPQLFS